MLDHAAHSDLTDQPTRSPRVRNGTSSLRRKNRDKERSSGRCSPAQSFPITNGSLYSDLSLNRKVSDAQRAKRRIERDSFNLTSSSLQGGSSLQGDLDGFDNPLDASQLTSPSPHPSHLNSPSPHPSLLSSPSPRHSSQPSPRPSMDISQSSPNSSISSHSSSNSWSNNCSLSTSLPLEGFGLNNTNDRYDTFPQPLPLFNYPP